MKIKTKIIILSAVAFFSFSFSYAGTVVVKPGRFDHFVLQIPERLVAGEGFIIKAQIYDFHKNIITNFSESGKEFKVTVTGSATVQTSHLGPASFPGGSTNITVTDKKSEPIIFSIYEVGGTVPVVSREIVISPNKLNHFIVQTPSSGVAGKGFEAKIIAKDAFDNIVSDVEMAGKSVKVSSTGTSSARVISPSFDFRNGMASVAMVSEKIGNVIVEVQDAFTGTRGRSQEVVVNPAALSHFRINAPKDAVAGEPFEITLAAFDSYGNPVNDYALSGGGAALKSDGQAKLEPSFIKPAEFKNNEATVKVVYEKAEEISIIAKEHNKNPEGKSTTIRINPARADSFIVATPDSATAGQPFKIRVEAYDRYNNIVRNYNLAGSDVILRVSGSGALTPPVILPSEFIDGVATVEVTYNKAESFSISATMGKKAPERITIKEEGPAEKVEEVKKPAPELLPPPEKKVEKEVSPEIKKEEKKPPVKKVKKEKPAKEPRKEPKVEENKREAKIVPPKEVAKPFIINNVSIIEASEKAMLVINTTSPDGNLEYYKGEIESRLGRKWLKIKVKPAIIKTERSMKFKSQFIGEVLIEDDKTAPTALLVYVELIPARVSFDIARIKDSLIVTVAKP